MLASCFAIAFGLLGLSWLFERGLDRWRSQRAVDRTGGRGLIGRILAEGITPLAGLSKAVLRITFFGLFVEGVVREVRRLDYRTDLVPMGTVLLAFSGLVFSLAFFSEPRNASRSKQSRKSSRNNSQHPSKPQTTKSPSCNLNP